MQITCYLDGCDRRAKCRGLCTGHYERWRIHGDNFDRSPLIEYGAPMRFIEQIVATTSTECVFWPFARISNGYGTVGGGGYHKGYAHRIVCVLAHGEPPTPKHHAAHSCGNGHLSCVNPNHLSWKTPIENAADRIDHGTDNRGEKSPHSILRETDVVEIRRSYAAGNTTYEELAERYGVTYGAIGSIIRRQNWRHVA